MTQQGVQESGEVAIRVEVVHESARSRISRIFVLRQAGRAGKGARPGHTLIRKEALGPDADRRAREERAMLERLRDVPGITQLADADEGGAAIVLVDLGTTTLAAVHKPLPVARLTQVAIALTRAVAEMHARGVIHRNISSENVVIASDGAPHLVDFGLATQLAEIRPQFTHHSEIRGTLAYLAPEQTGRTARSIDQRADLYALGAVLYELATGQPPFGWGDPLRLTHDHLARIPVPPASVNKKIPQTLSRIVMHLLEKEPDNRYQTAAGLLHDLEHLHHTGDADGAGAGTTHGKGGKSGNGRRTVKKPLRVGAHDVPSRLLPPSRLVGRDAEVAALQRAFEESLIGHCGGVLVSGAPGVGKTTLVDELRTVVTARDGWFIAGKFDQYRRDLEADAVNQALRALGRLLLAEPEEGLGEIRERVLHAAGPNAGLLSATAPEFAALLAVPPAGGDPLTAQVRTQRSVAQVVGAVASPSRPVVLFLDDMQWAGRPAVGLADLLLTEMAVDGLLLVTAYREHALDPGHPLAAPLSRWRGQSGVRHLRLGNLPTPALTSMVAEILHVKPAKAGALVEAIAPYTSGNPYETVELLNSLRRDELIVASADGWRWQLAPIRTRLRESEPSTLVAARVELMPAECRELLEAMACLGGRVELGLMELATGSPVEVAERAAARGLEDGLLIVEPGVHQRLLFRHDRTREAVLQRLEPARLRALRLAMARRLAEVPELFAVAAEQYLPEVDAVTDPAERARVVTLLRRAADQARLTGEYALVNSLLTGALTLVDQNDLPNMAAVQSGRHSALYSSGRLEEADEVFELIQTLQPAALERVDATAVQVISLTHRKQFVEALQLGIEALRALGLAVPPTDRLAAELARRYASVDAWLAAAAALSDPAEIVDPTLLAALRLINTTLPAAYYSSDLAAYGWLSLEALRVLVEHGLSPAAIGAASQAVLAAAAACGDYRTAVEALRRLVELGAQHGYEPETSQARLQFADLAWRFDPLESCASANREAREGLVAGGDLANAGYTYHSAVLYLTDCAPSIDVWATEVQDGLTFLRRTGSEQTAQWLEPYRWLASVLRGDLPLASAERLIEQYADNHLALLLAHLATSTAAVILDDTPRLAEHSAAAMPALPATLGLYPDAIARLVRGVAVARLARSADPDARRRLLAELEELIGWFTAAAAGAPENLTHQQRLLEAERAWAIDDFKAAALVFDIARRESTSCARPWHRALLAESAARFYLAHGMEAAGHYLLFDARRQYAAWGAAAKVSQLDWAYPSLPSPAEPARAGDDDALSFNGGSLVTTGTIDLLGILSASQALSSETEIERLHSRLVRVLSEIAGATAVQLLLWDEDRQRWLQPATGGHMMSANAPATVLRYLQRLREPLLVADATADERFDRDPYFAELDQCSLLALPIITRGELRAALLLENRLIRGAFTAERLEAVKLIAAQLAVSLENAGLYAELTASRARIVIGSDEARRRIARDLHDGAQQGLVGTILALKAAQSAHAARDLDTAAEQVANALARAESAQASLRELAHGILPGVLRHGGLRAAIQHVLAQIPVELEASVTSERFAPEIEANAYFIMAEALTNVAKHSGADRAQARAWVQDGALQLEIRDDGAGGAQRHGSGLIGIADRVAALGGELTISSPRGGGTRISVRLPLHDEHAQAAIVNARVK